MSGPIVLSTWSFGAIANEAAWPVLDGGGNGIDAVEAACRAVELDPSVNTVGVGGLPDQSGRVSLDGCVMTSPARCGSVCCVRRHAHPVSIARRVMDETDHIMLAGEDADAFADSIGFDEAELLTDTGRERFASWQGKQTANVRNVEEAERFGPEEGHDTVGVLALDSSGALAGACSTSGTPFKTPGRVGDSPVIGHGLYVDPHHGAVVATGTGELVMAVCGAFLGVEILRQSADPLKAISLVLQRVRGSFEMKEEHQVGLIALMPSGIWRCASLRKGFRVAVKSGDRDELVEPDMVLMAD